MVSLLSIFRDSPEYEARKAKDFTPPKATLAEIHASVPKALFQKSTPRALYYLARNTALAIIFYFAAARIDGFCGHMIHSMGFHSLVAQTVRWSLWATYWWWQSLAFAGLWTLGHEAGHGNLSPYSWFNHMSGYCMHTFLLVPYYAWRSSHHAHHKATGSIEREENYVPRTRSDYGLPAESKAHIADYHEIFEETPLYTLVRIIAMQLLGWHAYLSYNALGSPMYPNGTNHFAPSSPLFKPHERQQIIASNLGLSAMSSVLTYYTLQVGTANFVKFYFIPYLLCNHWIVMLTFLHHSDPTIPHYRKNEWSFLRGAAATIDRPLLGWMGRFFLHNVSHDHIAHHFFSTIPFYNQPAVTEHIKRVLKDDYNYDSGNNFYALYRSFSECCFIEDEGDIVFYKNKHGEAQRKVKGVEDSALPRIDDLTKRGDAEHATTTGCEVL